MKDFFKNNKLIFIGVISVISIIFLLITNPFSYNNAGNRQVVQTINGNLRVRFEPGLYWSGPFSKVTKWPNNVTIQVGPESKRSEDADFWSAPNTGTFAEGDQAIMGHTVKWDLPVTVKEMLDLHITYNNISNLATTSLMTYQRETASYSCQRMTSEQHYSGGQSQLKDFFQDQLRNGQVLLITSTKTDLQTDGTSKKYIIVEEKVDSKGNFVRSSIEDLERFNLEPSFVSIDYIKYDERIYKKLRDKIDAAADEATSKQRLITAQQQEQTALVEGRKLIADVRAKQEALEQEEIIQARKLKLVAAEKLEEDKYKAASIIALKKAEAEGDRLKVQAGLSPLEKAQIDRDTKIGVAKALAGPDGIVFPKIVTSGSGSNSSGALQTLEIKMLNDLLNDLTNSKK